MRQDLWGKNYRKKIHEVLREQTVNQNETGSE
jgi:hypothetical protein